MDKSIIIKSNRSGLSVFIEPTLTFDEVKTKIREKFRDSKRFFDDAEMAITFEGKTLSSSNINEILDIISQETTLSILAVLDNDESNELVYRKVLKRLMKRLDSDACEIYPFSVSDRNSMDFKGSVIILGNVEKNCQVHTNGSVFVLGNVSGSIYAGELGNRDAVIYAGSLSPQSVTIADVPYIPPKVEIKKGFFGKKKNREYKSGHEKTMLLRLLDDTIDAMSFDTYQESDENN